MQTPDHTPDDNTIDTAYHDALRRLVALQERVKHHPFSPADRALINELTEAMDTAALAEQDRQEARIRATLADHFPGFARAILHVVDHPAGHCRSDDEACCPS